MEYGNPSSSMRAFMEEISGSVRKIFSDAPPERPLVQLINWLTPADASAKALKCDVSDGRFSGKCVIFRHRASESLATDAHHIVRLLHYKVSKGVCAVFELECVGQSTRTPTYSVIGEPVAEFGSWRAEALAEEKAKLAGGFRVGERVVSLIDHAPVGVSRGDVGTAVGPSADARAADHAVRLSVDFGEGQGPRQPARELAGRVGGRVAKAPEGRRCEGVRCGRVEDRRLRAVDRRREGNRAEEGRRGHRGRAVHGR